MRVDEWQIAWGPADASCSPRRNLFFSTDVDGAVAEADVIFVSVNTPTKLHGIGKGRAADVKNCETCARIIARVATSPKIVIEKSTVPVKTAETIRRVLTANMREGIEFQGTASAEEPFLSFLLCARVSEPPAPPHLARHSQS